MLHDREIGKECRMSKKEELLRKQLKEEAEIWIKEEYPRRFQSVREALEKQGRETVEFLARRGDSSTADIASQVQIGITYARSELWRELEREAADWVEKEVKKRLKK